MIRIRVCNHNFSFWCDEHLGSDLEFLQRLYFFFSEVLREVLVVVMIGCEHLSCLLVNDECSNLQFSWLLLCSFL